MTPQASGTSSQPSSGSTKNSQNICTTSEVPRKNSTKTRAMNRTTAYLVLEAMPNTSAIAIAPRAPSTVRASVTNTPSRIWGKRSTRTSVLTPKFSKNPISPSIDGSPPGSARAQRAPLRGALRRRRWGRTSLQGGQIALAQQFGGHLLRRQLRLGEPVLADDRQVPLGIGDDLREDLVVGLQQRGRVLLVAEDGAAGAVLQHSVDLGDEALGDLDVDVGVLGQPVQRDAGQGEGVRIAAVDGVHAVLRAADLDVVQAEGGGVVGLDRTGHGGDGEIRVHEGLHVLQSFGVAVGHHQSGRVLELGLAEGGLCATVRQNRHARADH